MSKYYKEEDLQRALIGFVRETGIDELPYEYAVNVLDKLSALNIVHCGECNHRNTANCPTAWFDERFQEYKSGNNDNDFCSDGKE